MAILTRIRSNIPRNGLVGEWLFNSNVLDTSGNNLNGTIQNNVQYTTDRYNNPNSACLFDGISSWISVADNDLLSFTAGGGIDLPFSLSMWVLRISTTNTARLFNKRGGVTTPYEYSVILSGITHYYSFQISNSSGDAILYRSNVANISMVWTHVVLTYDGLKLDTSGKLYVNGIEETNLTVTHVGGIYDGMINTDAELSIGSFSYSPISTNTLNGKLDDIRLYNRTLSESEIGNLYNETISYHTLSYSHPKRITVTNGGGDDTTDWVDTNVDGLADSWTQIYSTSLETNLYTIVTGNGFTGNAQRCEAVNSYTHTLSTVSNILELGKVYRIKFKYRLNFTGTSQELGVMKASNQILAIITGNVTGNAQEYEFITNPMITNDGRLNFRGNATNMLPGDYFEIDEVQLTEINVRGVLEHGYGDDFVFTIDTSLGDGSSFTLPLWSGFNYDMEVFWDDGSKSTITAYNDADITHSYAEHGIYQIRVRGTCEAWYFNNTGDKLKIISVDNWGKTDFKALSGAFYGCSNLKTIPYGPISGNLTDVINGFASTFQNCPNLEIMLHKDMFRNHINLSYRAFYSTFYGCSKIYGSIPEDIFKYNINVSFYAFASVFSGCSGLTGNIPQNLFRYNTNVASNGFNGTFNGCTGLSGNIPADLFRYNTLNGSFGSCFGNCSGLSGTIPTDLFRYNTNALSMSYTFTGCSGLTSIPEDLFYYNNLVTSYDRTFQNCRNLVLPTRLFNLSNISIVTTFYYFMYTTSSTYSNTGTIQDIWNYTSGSPSITNAFFNQTALSNYGDIPAAWK